MYRVFLYLIVFFASCPYGFSQIRVSGEIEAGVNCSGLPQSYTGYQNNQVKYMPTISPVLGLWTKVKFGKRFSFNLGVQHLNVGYKLHEHTNENNEYGTYTIDVWKTMSFQKLSIPFIIGYDFNIKKHKSTFCIGLKKNYFFKGQVIDREKWDLNKDVSRNSDYTLTDDPFTGGQLMWPAKRWNSGIFLGWGIDITKSINMNITYSALQRTHYVRGCFGYIYDNNDLTFSFRYSIFSGGKSVKE